MSNQSPETLLKITMLSAFTSVKYHQGLIDEWDDPKGIVTQAAVMIKKIHTMYGREAFAVFQMLQNKCKHPKKMRGMCGDGIICCMDCNADLTEEQIVNTNTPTLMKDKVRNRRKLVKKYATQKINQVQIAQKLKVSLSTIEKDIQILKN